MPAQSQTISNPAGFHARPARHFVEIALRYECKVTVRKGTKVVNGKSILAMLTLGAKYKDTLIIETEGIGADEALAKLTATVNRVFAE